MSPRRGWASRSTGVVVALVLWGAAFAFLIALPPTLNISDESRILFGAKRVWQGEAIYHDFFEFFAPGSFYFFALVYALFGPTLQAARVGLMAVNALSTVLVYVLARRVSGMVEALLAAVVFAVVCVPIWNTASPHWLGTCFCLGTAAVLLPDRQAGVGRLRLVLAGALGGLTFSTLQHRGVLLGVWLAVASFLLVGAGAGRRRTRWLRALGWVGVGWVCVVLVILGHAVWHASLAELVAGTFTHVVFAYAPAFVGKASWGRGMGAEYTFPWLSVLVLAVPVLEAVALLVRRNGRGSDPVRSALLVLAACMTIGATYFPDLIHLCFILPFTLIVAAGLVHRLADSTRLGHAARLIAPALVLTLAAALAKGWTNQMLAHARVPVRYETAFGTVAGTATSRQVLEEIRLLVDDVPADRRTFFSYPVDASLYLTVPGANPTPFSFLMREYNTPAQFQMAFAALDRKPPDYLIVMPIALAEDDPVMARLRSRYRYRAAAGRDGLYAIYERTDAGHPVGEPS